MTEPTDAEIWQLWMPMARKGVADPVEFARAALEKWGTPAPVGLEPLALLVRKNSWRDGQWEAAPPNSPSYGLAWANQRVYVYKAPQPTQAHVGEVVVTTDAVGQCVAVTRQDDEGRILSIIWQAQQSNAGAVPLTDEQTQHAGAEHIPHTCGGFCGAFFAQHKRFPLAQEIWDAAIRSYRDLRRAPAVVPWRSAVLDLIDECPGLTMEQDQWLSRRIKELDFASTPQPTQAQTVAVSLTCEWTHNDDDGFWETACGKAWRFDDGGPKENNMNFCHCCGKTLRIKGGQHGAE